jgi:hypothetical protein
VTLKGIGDLFYSVPRRDNYNLFSYNCGHFAAEFYKYIKMKFKQYKEYENPNRPQLKEKGFKPEEFGHSLKE